MKKEYPITYLSREDLEDKFTKEQIESLDDNDMEYIARKMGDAYTDCCYWIALEDFAKRILEDKKLEIV